MNKAKWMALSLGSICALLCAPVQAQQTYRCGKVFQDRPCDGNTQINSAPATAGTTQNSNRTPANLDCARRGEEAQKIVWAKEAGRTEEMQLAATTHSEQKRLISEVYRRRGTSGEMRAAIEGDCNAERDRAAQAAALIQAGRLLQQDSRPPAAVAPAAPSGPTEAEQAAAARRDAMAAANKASQCKSYNARLSSIREEQRTGTSASNMERLNRDYAETDRSRRDLGC